MRVDRLVVENFRNIEGIELEPGAATNVIWGDNAQGKTNLLEALWLFCGARSFRGARDRDLTRFGQGAARLQLGFTAGGREQEAELAFSAEKKKISLNGVVQQRAADLAGRFCAVVFSPDQLSMIKQGPEGRRRFLDVSLGQILPKYQKVLESYERILKQRAFLLRDAAGHPALLDTLDVWDGHLVQYGGYIMSVRARYAGRLQQMAAAVYDGISSGRESFSLSYTGTAADGGAVPADREQCEALLREALGKNRGEDLRAGATTAGPHRDDLYIAVGGISARSFASQGQQRSCVLALKLAECALLAESVGEQPVVLLDDVMSELDEGRRNYLLNHLEGRQVFITCCDAQAFTGLAGGRVWRIEQGGLASTGTEKENGA